MSKVRWKKCAFPKKESKSGYFFQRIPLKNRCPSHKPTFCHATAWETSQAALWWHKWHPDRSIGHRSKRRGDIRCPNTLASALPKTATLIKPKGRSMLSMASRFLQMWEIPFEGSELLSTQLVFYWCEIYFGKSLLQVLWYECDDRQQQIWGLCHGRSPHNEIKQTNKRELSSWVSNW